MLLKDLPSGEGVLTHGTGGHASNRVQSAVERVWRSLSFMHSRHMKLKSFAGIAGFLALRAKERAWGPHLCSQTFRSRGLQR